MLTVKGNSTRAKCANCGRECWVIGKEIPRIINHISARGWAVVCEDDLFDCVCPDCVKATSERYMEHGKVLDDGKAFIRNPFQTKNFF